MIIVQNRGGHKIQIGTVDFPVPRKGERVQVLNTEIDGRVLDVRYIYRQLRFSEGSPAQTILDRIEVELEGWKQGFGKD